MSLTIRNTQELTHQDNFRFVGMIYGLSGTGKTSWCGTLDPKTTGIAACETGNGSGVLSIAEKGFQFVEPENLMELESFCKGGVFPEAKALVVDSISALVRTVVKDAALKIPRKMGDSPKRQQGILELDDYQTLGELTRRILNTLIQCNPDKHIIVTALEKYDRPSDTDAPGTEALTGPELPGAMFLASPALFDFVLRLRTRPKLKNPADPKTRYTERYIQTIQSQGVLAKSRATHKGVSLLDPEEVVNFETGQGTFPYILEKIIKGYQK